MLGASLGNGGQNGGLNPLYQIGGRARRFGGKALGPKTAENSLSHVGARLVPGLRTVTSYEHSLNNLSGIVHLACTLILLRYL